MWCIFYKDGSTFSFEDGSPDDAPRLSVQVIAEFLDGRSFVHKGGEFFEWDGEGWSSHSSSRRADPGVCFKHGGMIDDDRFQEILTRAMAWTDERRA